MAIPPGQAPWPVDLPPWMSSNNANEYTIDSFPDHKANQRNESKSALERAAMVPLLTNNRMKSTPVYRFIILSPQAPSRIDLLESYSEASIDRDFKAGLLGKGSTEICSVFKACNFGISCSTSIPHALFQAAVANKRQSLTACILVPPIVRFAYRKRFRPEEIGSGEVVLLQDTQDVRHLLLRPVTQTESVEWKEHLFREGGRGVLKGVGEVVGSWKYDEETCMFKEV